MLIHNVRIFTNDRQSTILTHHAIVIEGSRIHEIGPETELETKYESHKHIDAGGRLLMPGLINCHNHFYGTFARGLALQKAPGNFHEILKYLWWRLDSALDLKSVYCSALVQAISAIKNGVTAVVDHHASPNAIEGSLDKIEDALDLLGLRGVLCYEISDRDGRDKRQAALNENERFIRKCLQARKENPDHLFDGMVGLHASFTLDDESLNQAAELGQTLERGCHIHVLEDEVDRTITQEKYGAEVVPRLARFGLLGKKSIAAHGIYLHENEMALLAANDTMVMHNPQSNMNNAVGRADVFKLMSKGLLVGLGTDGMSADIKPDVRMANLLHKHDLTNSNVGWQEFQQILLRNNPAIYQRLTGQQVGKIEAGYLADLILIDYFPPTPMTGENFWGHFLFGIADAAVDTTIINGRVIMQNKQIAGLDEEAIAAHARECAKRVWARFSQYESQGP
ncbi:MAG: putative aminohydrolase SsnA [bacterium]